MTTLVVEDMVDVHDAVANMEEVDVVMSNVMFDLVLSYGYDGCPTNKLHQHLLAHSLGCYFVRL